MDTKRICSGCQKLLAPNAPDGLCPECLIKAGLGTGVDIGPDTQPESGRIPFVAPTLEEVARLFPQLEILGFIGQGGMGAVYKARQKALDRVVALKILPPGIGKDPAFAERFTREAKALARLNHPGVVTLYEFGQADGLFFFLMEFVDGVSLRHLLEVERISAREAMAIVPQICDALQYAHDQGIVHRDIKPENILLDRQGRVKVADFGLAKLVGQDRESAPSPETSLASTPALTESGKVMGTPQYMAPEQRKHPTEVDHRADIYSLGVVFYQMLTGELPGKPIEPPSRKVQIDVRLDEVVLRALEKEPERRYPKASQVKSDVETIARTLPATPQAGSRPPQTEIFSPPRLSRFAVVGVCLVPLCLLALWALLFHQPAPLNGWQIFFGLAALIIGGAAPFATTILGGIAVAQIRHSAGRLYGLGLALFDALLFPLLALDGLFYWCYYELLSTSAVSAFFDHRVWAESRLSFVLLLTLITSALVDFLIVRAVWRAVKKPQGESPPASQSRGEQVQHNDEAPRDQALWYGFIVSLIGLPIGLAMKIPYVWGLSAGGILLGGAKLGLIGMIRRHLPGHGTHPPPASRTPHELRSLARLALGLLLAGVLGTLIPLVLHGMINDLALLVSSAALVFALIVGVLARRNRLGRAVAIMTVVTLGTMGIMIVSQARSDPAFRVVLTGKQALDLDTGQLASWIAKPPASCELVWEPGLGQQIRCTGFERVPPILSVTNFQDALAVALERIDELTEAAPGLAVVDTSFRYYLLPTDQGKLAIVELCSDKQGERPDTWIVGWSLYEIRADAGGSPKLAPIRHLAPGGGTAPKSSPAEFVLNLRLHMGLDLDTGTLRALRRGNDPNALKPLDIAWIDEGGSALARISDSTARILGLGDAQDFEDAALKTAQQINELEDRDASLDFAGSYITYPLSDSKDRFFAVLTDQGNLAVVEVKEFDKTQATIHWRLLPKPRTNFSPTGSNVFRLPDNRSVRLLIGPDRATAPRAELPAHWWFGQFPEWQPAEAGQGEVLVPSSRRLGLIVSGADWQAAAFLAGLKPDDLEVPVFSCENMPTKPNDFALPLILRLTGLKTLVLDQAEISDAGLSSLRQLPALERLAFVSQELSEQGLAHLAECRSLKGLRFSPAQRLKAASLAPLAKLAVLEELFLGGAGAEAEGLGFFSKLSSLRRLVVRNVTPEMLEQIAKLSSLRQLEFSGTTFNSDEPLQSLVRLDHLESLSIGGYLVTDAALGRLKSLRSLKHLTLRASLQDTRPGISDVGLAHLKEMHALETLELYYGGQCTQEGLRHLGDVPALRKLVMPNKEVADAGLSHLQELPRLEHLLLRGKGITDQGLQYLARLPGLKTLELWEAGVSEAGVARFRQARPEVEFRIDRLTSDSTAPTPKPGEGHTPRSGSLKEGAVRTTSDERITAASGARPRAALVDGLTGATVSAERTPKVRARQPGPVDGVTGATPNAPPESAKGQQ